ncbi:hypothetical protein TIFTF001_003570 [Ficus carica]|uniref:Uncharacterized protein n=1 Tax=Ficus carica TaxID=3494 RepID=A0AA87ZSD8_FICCA|nr:hypothetical protein TIFTF001_003570 [Ficus carica]
MERKAASGNGKNTTKTTSDSGSCNNIQINKEMKKARPPQSFGGDCNNKVLVSGSGPSENIVFSCLSA